MTKILIFLFILQLNITPTFAQNEAVEEKLTEEQLAEKSEEQEKVERLMRFRSELITLSSEIRKVERELEGDISMVSRIQQESRLVNMKREYEDKRFKFIQAISGVDLASEESAKESSFTEDIKQILEPVILTFKKVSEKPRKIQELSDKKESVSTRLAKAKVAKDELEKFMQENKKRSLNGRLKDSLRLVEKMVSDLEKVNDDLNFEQKHLEENQESIFTTFSSIIFDFIKTKGKNLVFAILIFALVYWGFRYSQEKFINLLFYRLQRSENREFYDWLIRPTRVIYSVLTFLVAFFMSILTLYVLNDWILVTIILITFAALIWSSKQYFPVFFEQSKIVLNLGAVRESERLIYNGLPWKIKNLGYYGRLHNPELDGGLLRVSTKEMLNLNSRKFSESEPWFPTKKGDWVEDGDVFGQVILQTPEQVIVQKIGGERVYYNTSDFYSMAITNLSQGFAVEFSFGIDYSHQNAILDEAIPHFKKHIDERLKLDYPQIKESIQRSSLDFLQAGASSLDIRVFYKMSGELAPLKLQLTRSMQTYMLEACNKFDYIIPFNQLTVHMQK